MVIFKGKRVPRGQYPSGIVIRMQENGWMDEELMKEWLEAVWKPRLGGQNKRSLLVFNSFEGQLKINAMI